VLVREIKKELLATDNYIEKYLPMKMLNYIHDAMMYVLDKKELIKLFDYLSNAYQVLEEGIANDDGKPRLEKRDFSMPALAGVSLTRK
jgi:hypothetical protein